MNLNEIDTTDCDMSLVSLQVLTIYKNYVIQHTNGLFSQLFINWMVFYRLQNVARKIYGENWMERLTVPVEEPA